MGTLTNSEDPDEMLHNAAFPQDLHCLLKTKEILSFFEITPCDPSIYTMDHPDFIVRRYMENSTGLKWVNL